MDLCERQVRQTSRMQTATAADSPLHARISRRPLTLTPWVADIRPPFRLRTRNCSSVIFSGRGWKTSIRVGIVSAQIMTAPMSNSIEAMSTLANAASQAAMFVIA